MIKNTKIRHSLFPHMFAIVGILALIQYMRGELKWEGDYNE